MTVVTSLSIDSGGLALEGVLYAPYTDSTAVVVVCHPHPLRGGDMHNNVVMVIVQALNAAGVAALTFNFRGVGRSEGVHDSGAGEQDDVRAALACARSLPGAQHVGLAGYSFGAGVAATVVDASCGGLCLVSGSTRTMGPESGIARYQGPAMLILGDADRIATPDELRTAAAAMSRPPEVVIEPGADHFWWGHEVALYESVRRFFAGVFGTVTAE